MSHLTELTGLKAITINGAIVVESQEDIKRREQRRKERKSRWSRPSETVSNYAPQPKKKSNILLPEDVKCKKLALSLGRPSEGSTDLSTNSTVHLQMPTIIDAASMDEKSQQIYLIKMQIHEATVKLSRPDLGIPANPRERSPSPEPVYSNKGVRINKREDRVKNRLINQRNAAITKLKALDPTYHPPASFKYKDTQLEDRVFIPADEYPHLNFVGLLLGPRGRFLEELKVKTKTNIVIRGRGSLKSGMTGITKDGRRVEGLEDPLHAYITGQTAEDVKAAAKEVEDLINMQVYNPDCEKAVALRSKHMHDLAVLNGTLKDIDLKCMNCGRLGHKTWQCDDSKIYTASVICSACGGIGHVTRDCRQRRPGETFNVVSSCVDSKVIDKEYSAFLSDMGLRKSDQQDCKSKSAGGLTCDPANTLNSGAKESPKMLMLSSNGAVGGQSAPGAASAEARAISSGQNPGGMQQVMGKSIFGGKLTRLTSGYKSQAELELERKKRIEEYENRPVPLEWRVEKYEQRLHKHHEEYLKNLEHMAEVERRRSKGSSPSEKTALLPSLTAPPPLPPGSSSVSDNDDGLPKLIGNPMASLVRR